jgi:phosphatidylserine/phosphatidylglycerophosphate/cardiolipin synthase-like enzyme
MDNKYIYYIIIGLILVQAVFAYSFVGKDVRLYFCAVDDCEKQVVELIGTAEESIYFMTFSFTSEEIANAIIQKRNLKVKGIIEKQQNSQYCQYDRLKEYNVNVKFDKNKYFMHHKVFIIDEEYIVTGSFNPTKGGNERNDENMLIIKDKAMAKRYIKEFYRIW